MKLKYFFLALGLLFITTMSAQGMADATPQYQNQLTLTIGLNNGYFRDRNYSPLNYKSSGTRFGLSYGRITASGHRWTGGLALGLGTLKHPTDYDRHPRPERYQIDLSVGYLRKVGQVTDDRRSWLGVKYRSTVDLTLYDGAEAVTFYGLHALKAALATDWKTGDRHRLSTEVSLPVFGLLSRPPYTGWDKFIVDNAENIPKVVTRGDWVSLGAFAALRASAAWTYDFGQRWSTSARYDFSYFASKRIDPVRLLDNTFSLSSTLKF
ncbi:hypothetical protein [Neolewinella agarilytica]|uniref:hypothetical protein n=1 Tax=Neolewinella agarilytica TaxID=478744 RepID=UPI002355D69B|nr:hypothetical protein [Neolewinella agarilytica]